MLISISGPSGCRKADYSEACRTGIHQQQGSNLRNHNKANVLLTVCTLANEKDIDQISMEYGKIVINGIEESCGKDGDEESGGVSSEESSSEESGGEESDEEVGGQSNLQKLATSVQESTKSGNGSVAELMKLLIHQCGFLIGPSSHGYYSGEWARASKYEHEMMELIHPDLRPSYEPGEGVGQMRKFY